MEKNLQKALANALPPSIVAAGPSLQMMLDMNKKKRLYRMPTFWYYYRIYYPYGFSLLMFIFLIVSQTGWKNVEGNLVLGSVLSLIGSLTTVFSYVMILPWRKHPSSLVVYRSLTSIAFSINILLNAIHKQNVPVSPRSCHHFAVITEMMLLAGEGWLTTIALDLVQSLTNPFASYKWNIRKYTIMVWGFTCFMAMIFSADESCQGNFDNGICWMKVNGVSSSCLWGYYLFWILCMYIYQIYAAGFAYVRLSKGLSATFEIRKQTAQETFKCLAIYAFYLSCVFFFFCIISGGDKDPNNANTSLFLLFLIANRGSVDSVVWFTLHDFARNPESVKVEFDNAMQSAEVKSATEKSSEYEKIAIVDEEEEKVTKTIQRRSSGLSKTVEKLDNLKAVRNAKKEFKKTFTELADLAIADFDESDLSPQVNMALRKQIVSYVSTGVKKCVSKDYTAVKSSKLDSKDKAVVDGIKVSMFLLDNEHPFKEFAPDVFRDLRICEGIDDVKYLDVISQPAKERLSEGASGAFMIFCGGGQFIIKTIKCREAKVLHQSLPAYTSHLKRHPESLLCRFLGSYSLKMYSQTFYFVVMLNCFDPSAVINERFDIKGSWVGRSAEPSKASTRVVCRHCNSYFVPSAKEDCTESVGKHEENIVLKDNDLRVKVSLHPVDAKRVRDILKLDSTLLGELGVMDYSLLMGVRKWKYPVSIDDNELDLKNIVNSHSSFKAHTLTGPAVYYFGIVDFLQDWTPKKTVERHLKIYLTRKDPDGLSVMKPLQYMKRFQTKMDQIFELNEGDDIEANMKTSLSSPMKASSSGSSLSTSSIKVNISSNTTNTTNPLAKPYNPYADIANTNTTSNINTKVNAEVKSSSNPSLTTLFPSISDSKNDATAFDDDDDDLDENLVLI